MCDWFPADSGDQAGNKRQLAHEETDLVSCETTLQSFWHRKNPNRVQSERMD